MNRKQILLSDTLNQQFYDDGFVKFHLIDKDSIEKLKNFYLDNVACFQKKQNPKGFHTTSNTGNNDLIIQVDSFIKSIILSKINEHLINTNFTISNFLVKESGDYSAVPPHQDWLLVDESRHTSFNIWICLDEVNEDTGYFNFIPKSHLINFSHRASGLPRYFDNFQEKLDGAYHKMSLLPGECVIFHHSIIHSSSKNISGKNRISCVLGGYEKEAKLFFHTPSEKKNKIKKHHISIETFLNMGENYEPTIGVYSTEEEETFLDIWTYQQFKTKVLKQSKNNNPLNFIHRFLSFVKN